MKKSVASKDDKLYHLPSAQVVTKEDGVCIDIRERQYQASWKQRGGVGAFMMLARKMDRIEAACEKAGYDIFTAIENDAGPMGLIDDLRDLRGYLILVEAEMRTLGIVTNERPHIDINVINKAK